MKLGPSSFRRFARDRRGVSAVEFALMTPIILLTAVGVADFGLAIDARMKIEGEVGATQLKILQLREDPAALTALRTELQTNVTDLVSGLTLQSSNIEQFCACEDKANSDLTVMGNRITCSSKCGTDTPWLYYRITVSARYDLPFPFGPLSSYDFRIDRIVQANAG